VIFLLVYMGLYEIFDSYTCSFYPSIVSFIIADFGITVSDYYTILGVASFGLYFVFFIQFLCDKIGRKPIMIIVFFGMGFGTFLLGFSRTILFFTFSLLLMYIFFRSDIWVIMISEKAPPQSRARYSYIVYFIGVIGIVLIPIFRTWLIDANDPHTWVRMTYIAWAAMPLAFLGIFLKETRKFKTLESHELSRESFSDLWKKSFNKENTNRQKMLVFIGIGFALGVNYTTFNTIEEFLSSNIADKDLVTLIITFASAGALVVYGLTGILADKFGRKRMIVLYAVLFLVSLIGLILTTQQLFVPGILIAIFIVEIGYFGVFTLSKVFCVECFETEIRGASAGWRSFAYAIGLTIGAFYSARLTRLRSLAAVYIFNALFIGIMVPILVILWLPETKKTELQ
jgi:MHS family alpha-ketoglutarate permease-like MFS transporter